MDSSSTEAQSDRGSSGIAATTRRLTGAAPRVSLGDIVAERLREAILDDELKPGEFIREGEVADSMAVSRGPVRDALILLEREGLVRISRNRGARVVDLTVTELGEVYSLRSTLEELAVRLAIRRADDADIAALEEALEDMRRGYKSRPTAVQAAKLDIAFHDAIFRAAHHDRLMASWATIRMQARLILHRRNTADAEWRGSWRGSSVGGHKEILDLVKQGNENAAADLLRSHIATSFGRVVDSMATDPSDGASAQGEIKAIADSFLLS